MYKFGYSSSKASSGQEIKRAKIFRDSKTSSRKITENKLQFYMDSIPDSRLNRLYSYNKAASASV